MKEKSRVVSWSFNMWLSYGSVALIMCFFNQKAVVAFTIGSVGAQLVLLMMYEDMKRFLQKGVKTVKIGFYKRYIMNAIVLGFSSIFGVESLIFAFFGLELTRLTLTTSVGEW